MKKGLQKFLAAALAALGLIMMAAGGIFGGEAAIVLQKAIYVCLECIGIG